MIGGTAGLSAREPTMEFHLRSSKPPEWPCSEFPAKAPMSDWPVAGMR